MYKKRKNILVVEDNDVQRQQIKQALEGSGFIVTLESNGLSGWEKLNENTNTYSTVILDRTIPGLSGLDFLKKMRTISALRHIPVILQIGTASDSDIMEGIEAGAYYYLPKPYETGQLVAVTKAAGLKFIENQLLCHKLETSEKSIESFSLIQKGTMNFVLSTPDDVVAITKLLSHAFPDANKGTKILFELLINAIEHGSLGFSYDDKSRYLELETWDAEVANRIELEEYASKKVNLSLFVSEGKVKFRIEDEGEGFDWTQYMDFAKDERIFDLHGRGIAMCNHECGFQIDYLGKGNIVEASIER